MTFPRALARLHRRFSAFPLRLAGRGGALADLEHVGRVSGTVRHTPLRAFLVGDSVLVGANFGSESDWVKNIRAAGTCRMRLGDELLDLGEPRVLPVREGIRGMPWWFGLGLRFVVRTKECVELPVLNRTPATEPKGPARGTATGAARRRRRAAPPPGPR
jgi:deazaflavin-dependent oxidoreductase (nitroreductase family)